MTRAALLALLMTVAAPLAHADDATRLILTLEKGDDAASLVYQGMPAISADGKKVVLPEPGLEGYDCHAGGNVTHAVLVLPLASAEKGGSLVNLKAGCNGDDGVEEVAALWKPAVDRVKKLQAAIDTAAYKAVVTTAATGKVTTMSGDDGEATTNLPATAQVDDVKVSIAKVGKKITVHVEAKGLKAIDKKAITREGFVTAGRVFVAPGARRVVLVELTWLKPRAGMMKANISSTDWVAVPLPAAKHP